MMIHSPQPIWSRFSTIRRRKHILGYYLSQSNTQLHVFIVSFYLGTLSVYTVGIRSPHKYIESTVKTSPLKIVKVDRNHISSDIRDILAIYSRYTRDITVIAKLAIARLARESRDSVVKGLNTDRSCAQPKSFLRSTRTHWYVVECF